MTRDGTAAHLPLSMDRAHPLIILATVSQMPGILAPFMGAFLAEVVTGNLEELRQALLSLLSAGLSPLARRYGYAEMPLEDTVKWRPLVLLIGNYSSGKSTLINELVGAEIQATGQAPTDDCFTVLTCDEGADLSRGVQVVEEREGSFLIGDPHYPFAPLKRHGQKFASHFRLKKVTSPFLKPLALIDTPGMLDSITERDRGYDYQAVVGDLASMADLILVLFDAHKAGTLREAHLSLRDTLPARAFEDRVNFVLNRVDECTALGDLLRVYGTLCWNLSQMLGRKDMPPIRLTWASGIGAALPPFLAFADNQRDDLKRQIRAAPSYRLDHLAAYVEMHAERLAHLIEAVLSYRRGRRSLATKMTSLGLFLGVLAGIATALGKGFAAPNGLSDSALWIGVAVSIGFSVAWWALARPLYLRFYRADTLARLEALTPLGSQGRKDSWSAVKDCVHAFLQRDDGSLRTRQLKADHEVALRALDQELRRVRGDLALLPR